MEWHYAINKVPLAARRRASLLCSRKEEKPEESAPRKPPQNACASRPGRVLAELADGLTTPFGLDTGSRNLPAEAAMLGGGYGAQRQRPPQHPVVGFDVPPLERAEHRSLSRGSARAPVRAEPHGVRPASCAAPGLSEAHREPR